MCTGRARGTILCAKIRNRPLCVALSIVKPSFESEAVGAAGSTSSVGRVGEAFIAAVSDPKTGETVYLGEFSTEQEANDAVAAYLKDQK